MNPVSTLSRKKATTRPSLTQLSLTQHGRSPPFTDLLRSATSLLSLQTIVAASLLSACSGSEKEEEWTQLFNGKDLTGWKIKIRGHELNENFGNTFRVEDGILKVCYDEYDQFGSRFGHIFFHQPFSHYRLRAEYRFTGSQAPGSLHRSRFSITSEILDELRTSVLSSRTE